jgi:DNA helicase-4
MICGAADLVKSSAYQSPYQYILVDEFQDVSVGRANLLKALCEQHIDNQLFAVGDDWQSIYRFAGSDISVMRNFASFFGATAKSTLATTYRYNQELADASGRFIEANPAQLKKNVKGLRRRNAPAVYIARSSEGFPNLLDECLRRIQQESDPADVLLLGRYRHNRPKNWSALQDAFPRLSLRYQTAHSAKGLEADYVVVIELSAGTYGFPSEIEDDPLLSLVLAADEPYAHAEERRLFYVALTRARHATFLVAPNARCSAFVEELESGKYLVEVFGDEMASRVRCPACSTGLLSVREGEHGSFVGCEHYPRCTYAASVCPTCRHGIVKFDKNKGACNACSDEFVVCPQCAKGYLHKRVGKFGDFLGCTGYPACKYTQSTSTANSRKRESR